MGGPCGNLPHQAEKSSYKGIFFCLVRIERGYRKGGTIGRLRIYSHSLWDTIKKEIPTLEPQFERIPRDHESS